MWVLKDLPFEEKTRDHELDQCRVFIYGAVTDIVKGNSFDNPKKWKFWFTQNSQTHVGL